MNLNSIIAVIITLISAGTVAQATGQPYKCGLAGILATCQDYVANYNDLITGRALYTYQSLNYSGFNAGASFTKPPLVVPINTGTYSSFIRAAGQVGSQTRPSITGGGAINQKFAIQSLSFACGKPGASYPLATQQGVACKVSLTAYSTLANLVPVGAGSLFSLSYVPVIDAQGRTYMKTATLSLANAPLTPTGLLYPSFQGYFFSAKDTSGNVVDLFVDQVKYTIAALSAA